MTSYGTAWPRSRCRSAASSSAATRSRSCSGTQRRHEVPDTTQAQAAGVIHDLVSRDLRSRVLPLYLCRPLSRRDYPLAKYIALTAACLLLIELPLLILYVGTIASAKNGSAVWAETRALIPGLGMGVLWAVMMAAIGLVLASLAGRRAYATGIVAITCFLTWTLSILLIQVQGGLTATATGARVGGLFSPFTVLDGLRMWLGGTSPGEVASPGRYGPLYGVVAVIILAASLGGLAARYRKVSQS